MKNSRHGVTYLVVCVTLRALACVLTGGRERGQEGDIDIEGNIQRSRSAVRPQLEWRATPVSAWGPLSLSLFSLPVVFLSLSFCPAGRAERPPPPSSSPPPPSLHLPDPGQFSPAMRGHLWEFIPDASCSLNPLRSLSPPTICHSSPCLPLYPPLTHMLKPHIILCTLTYKWKEHD